MSIQVFGSGGSANLTTTTITPKASTQTYSPSSSYDGYSSVTVNGDSNLISSNIVSRKSIFGVSGNYSPIPLIEHEMAKFTAYCSTESASRGQAWYISGSIPEKDDNSILIDLNKVVGVAIWTDAIPHNSRYSLEFFHRNIVESISNSQIKFFSYPYITISESRIRDYSQLYFNMCIQPQSNYINTSTREFKFPLTFNYGDGLLDDYLNTGSFTWGREFLLYTY